MKKNRIVMHVARQKCELQEQEPIETGPEHLAGPALATLISPGTELASAYCGDDFPVASGYAAVFRVEEIGSEAGDWEKGQLAFAAGHHSSWQRADGRMAIPVPPGLDPAKATMARLLGVSHTTLLTTRARPGETVLVTGAGPVGYLAAAQFQLAGYRVVVSEVDANRRATAAQLGIEVCESPDPDLEAALSIDCSGHEDAVLACCDATREGGEVVLIGAPWEQRSDAAAFQLLHKVFHRYLHLRSGWEWEIPNHKTHFSDTHTILGAWTTCLRWLAEDRIPLPEHLIALWPPEDCDAAYRGHLDHSHPHLCTVFDWRSMRAEV